MKHRAFTLVELIVIVAIIAMLVVMLMPVFRRSPCGGNARASSCQSNLKQIGLSLLQYTQDYDDIYPSLSVARSGYWAGSLQPYVKGWQIFQCPSEAGTTPKTTDYFLNARLAQQSRLRIARPTLVIALGDGSGDQLPLYHLSQLPARWADEPNSPARRHCDRANYLFIDGHVQSLSPEKITNQKPAVGQPTFEVKP